VLEQRNALLKSSEKPLPDLLHGFTEPMSKYAAYLTYQRLNWIRRLAQRLNDTVHKIAPHQPLLSLIYLSNWVPEIQDLSLSNSNLGGLHFTGHGAQPSLELLEQAFWKKQSSLEAAEWKSGHSLVGPHRDDWTFFLGGQVLKGHGSQGEVRSALLALKLSEVELFREATGHRPIFLLDDFSSELDRERRVFLLDFLSEKDLQVFVTTTDDSFFVGRCFWVVNGSLQPTSIETGRERDLPNGDR
jgi:DNA replication and repair protein RecF